MRRPLGNDSRAAEAAKLNRILLRPPIVELETVNICNAGCVFCLYGKDKAPKKSLMAEALFERVAAQIALEGTAQLCLVPMLGDPLLDDDIAGHAFSLRRKGNMDVIRLVTNGLAFDRHSDEALLQLFSSIDFLEISIGPNREVYATMFGVDRFEHLARQLDRISGLLERAAHKPGKVVLWGRACGDDFTVDPRLSALSRRLCGSTDIPWTRKYMDWGGKIENLPLSTPVIKSNKRGEAMAPCQYALSPHVYHDGRVGLCACAGADESLLIGNAAEQPWREILQSERRLEMIFSFLEGGMPEYCAKCSFYIPSNQIDWNLLCGESQSPQDGGNPMKPVAEDSLRFRAALLEQYKRRAKGILHLGAHLGQEAGEYAGLGKPAVWVEALPHIHARLAQHLEQFPDQRALCALLGDRNGIQKTFHISNNAEGASSSVFQFGDYGGGDKSLWPELKLAMVDSVTLPMLRLDTLLQGNGIDARNYDFWVVDLQGAELLALQGSGELLKHCRALYVEVSTVEVYQGGVLWPQLRQWLEQAGFVALWQPGRQHDDVLFIREGETQRVEAVFHSEGYVRHNQRRLEHLASLHLPLRGKTVLEVGAGIGDHTSFYLDRGCTVLTTDARPENLVLLRKRFLGKPRVEIRQLDMDNPVPLERKFDIIHCYGLLYHLQQPGLALRYLAEHCGGMLLLETCVSFGEETEIHPLVEPAQDYTQAFYGIGCRPTRTWVWNALKALFPHVYAPRTQPSHEEFPADWTRPPADGSQLCRAVFVASRDQLDSHKILLKELPERYGRT